MIAIAKAFALVVDILKNASLIVAGVIRGKGGFKMNSIDDFISIATKEVGYKETPVNITKYNEWADTINFWFTEVQGLAWCGTFVAWCLEKLADNHSFTFGDFCLDEKCCWVDRWKQNFVDAKRFNQFPYPGDLAFRNGHVAIVVSADPKTQLVTVIEGNSHDSVEKNTYGWDWWLGFGHPNWKDIYRIPVQETETTSAKEFVINQGIYIGKEDGEMHWGDNLTREEMALILYRYWKKFNK